MIYNGFIALTNRVTFYEMFVKLKKKYLSYCALLKIGIAKFQMDIKPSLIDIICIILNIGPGNAR
jgi:hypothetical protein